MQVSQNPKKSRWWYRQRLKVVDWSVGGLNEWLVGGLEGPFEMFVGQAPYAIRGGLKSEKEERTILSGR